MAAWKALASMAPEAPHSMAEKTEAIGPRFSSQKDAAVVFAFLFLCCLLDCAFLVVRFCLLWIACLSCFWLSINLKIACSRACGSRTHVWNIVLCCWHCAHIANPKGAIPDTVPESLKRTLFIQTAAIYMTITLTSSLCQQNLNNLSAAQNHNPTP